MTPALPQDLLNLQALIKSFSENFDKEEFFSLMDFLKSRITGLEKATNGYINAPHVDVNQIFLKIHDEVIKQISNLINQITKVLDPNKNISDAAYQNLDPIAEEIMDDDIESACNFLYKFRDTVLSLNSKIYEAAAIRHAEETQGMSLYYFAMCYEPHPSSKEVCGIVAKLVGEQVQKEVKGLPYLWLKPDLAKVVAYFEKAAEASIVDVRILLQLYLLYSDNRSSLRYDSESELIDSDDELEYDALGPSARSLKLDLGYSPAAHGIPSDSVKAKEYLMRAKELGSDIAMHELSKLSLFEKFNKLCTQ